MRILLHIAILSSVIKKGASEIKILAKILKGINENYILFIPFLFNGW
jgi:hypothetical protein